MDMFENLKARADSMIDARGGVDESRQGFSDFLNQLIERSRVASDAPALTSQDLFGESMQRLSDQTGAHANATKQAIARSLMSTGGDLSGSAAANILGIDQQLNESLGRNALNFENLTLGENRFQTGRADRLSGQGLQGLMAMYGMDIDQLQDVNLREQAHRQRQADFWGNLIQGVSTIIPGL